MKETGTMTSKKVCPKCNGHKLIVGQCECNSEWRSSDDEDGFDDCRCEPDQECPICKGTGKVD